MKKLTVQIIAVTLICLNGIVAFGFGGKLPPSNDYSGKPQCSWYDTGWDEDGGDSTKEACLVNHGECTQKCFIYKTVCEGTGVNSQGKKESVSGQSLHAWEARAKVYEKCNAYGLSSCMITSCQEESQAL
jgi:hypothetical protein